MQKLGAVLLLLGLEATLHPKPWLQEMLGHMQGIEAEGCPGRAREYLRSRILQLQVIFSI